LIWQPSADLLQGLRANIEYYRISQPNYIISATAQQLVSHPEFASRVTRDPATGLITTVDTSPLNAAKYKTSGWDLKVDYRNPTQWGELGVRVVGTYVESDLRQHTINSPFVEYAGFPNDGGQARLKANASFTWDYRNWTVSWTSTYYPSYWQTGSPNSPFTRQSGGTSTVPIAQGSDTIPSQIYHDLSVGFTFHDASISNASLTSLLENVSIQVGLKNVLNKAPPFDANNIYYYSRFGDPRLRTFRITLSKAF
jgi:hypothetical protein